MANRPVFISEKNNEHFVSEVNINFEWFPGFSVKQKQLCIKSLHSKFKEKFPNKRILEISSKSDIELGVALSAFNLLITTKNNITFSVESAFQASKVFEFGGPYLDLYEKTSKEAKKDSRLKNSGKLVKFQFFDRCFDLEPKTFFYDWLYINALYLNKDIAEKIMEYDSFTDIEFNPQKSINCQARAVALFVTLGKQGLLEESLKSLENYKKIILRKNVDDNYEINNDTFEQLDFEFYTEMK